MVCPRALFLVEVGFGLRSCGLSLSTMALGEAGAEDPPRTWGLLSPEQRLWLLGGFAEGWKTRDFAANPSASSYCAVRERTLPITGCVGVWEGQGAISVHRGEGRVKDVDEGQNRA